MSGQHHMLSTVCSSYLQKPKRRLQSTFPRNAYTYCRDLNVFTYSCGAVLSLQVIIVFLQMIVQVMIQPAVMHQFCQSHEDETSDESAELLSTEESEFGCQDNQDYCPTHQHQCKTVVSSVQSSSSSGTLSVSVVEGPESQEVARSAPKKRKIPVGIVSPNRLVLWNCPNWRRLWIPLIKSGVAKPPSVTGI